VTTTKINVPTKDEKERQQEKIAQDVKKYLANGGRVTKCAPRAFTLTEGPKKRFDGGRNDSLTDPTNRDVGAYRPTIKGT